MSDPLDWLDAEADARQRAGLVRRLTTFGASVPGRIATDQGTLINFASNDYLGLAADPRVVAAASEAAARYGWGAGASPLVCGWRTPHQELAEALAAFERVEAVALFPTGFAANLGTIAALVGRGDAVYADRLNHSCLIEGARLSGARLRVYPHADADALRGLLSRDRGRFRRTLIVTDGVFSMDGDLAPLVDLADLADAFEAMLLVDEAHGTGVFGPDGRGAASALGVADRVPIRVGTLSKALGSLGGFVAGSHRLIDQIINKAPTFMFSTALPPAAAAAAYEALRIAQSEPWRRLRCHTLGDALRRDLRARGFQVPSSRGSIVPVLVGEPAIATRLAAAVHAQGCLVPAIRPPTVPKGTSRLRISITAVHPHTAVNTLVEALASA